MSSALRNYNILIADADRELSHVLRMLLREMGFTTVHVTRSGRDAIKLLSQVPFDFLITEWNTQHVDGMSIIEHIRRDSSSLNPTLPIIMLTGRAEPSDVIASRDQGINEYVIKPFSARTIYNRLERIIDYPRPFVVSPNFVGPCRRRKGEPPAGTAERRVRTPKQNPFPKDAADIKNAKDTSIWLPDMSLKQKLGADVSLQSIITPNVLNKAQAAIESITADSLQWIKEDLHSLKQLHQQLAAGDAPDIIAAAIAEVALSINSRAGTFGYSRASEIAYMLYLFCRNKLSPRQASHTTIVQKYIEVLHVILGNQMLGNAGAVGAQIVAELRNLTLKHA